MMSSRKRPQGGMRARPAKRVAHRLGHPTIAVACMMTALLVWTPDGARSRELNLQSPAEICLGASQDLKFRVGLPRTASRIKSGGLLKIVAVGSSSTLGLWVLDAKAPYPAVLGQELARLRPKSRIEVINSGQVGDTIARSVSRFGRDVLAHQPDLVIWQLGTNDVAWGGQTSGLGSEVVDGVRRLKASGADVILMDQQYAPQVLSSSAHSAMQDIIADVARQENAGLFSRFELMRRSIAAGLSPGALVSFDGLHNSAEGYDCIGRALARMISASAP